MTATDRLNAIEARASETRWGRPGSTGAAHVRYAAQKEVAEYLPATIAALRAVLALHGAVQATWATKTGVGPFPFACEECSDVMWVPHPCPTVAAITEALT